jgi:hypothetical protein
MADHLDDEELRYLQEPPDRGMGHEPNSGQFCSASNVNEDAPLSDGHMEWSDSQRNPDCVHLGSNVVPQVKSKYFRKKGKQQLGKPKFTPGQSRSKPRKGQKSRPTQQESSSVILPDEPGQQSESGEAVVSTRETEIYNVHGDNEIDQSDSNCKNIYQSCVRYDSKNGI